MPATTIHTDAPPQLEADEPVDPALADEQLLEAFVAQVRQMPGVLRVAVVPRRVPAKYVVVYLPKLASELSRQVIELDGRLTRANPHARLHVELEGVEQSGQTLEELLEKLPPNAKVLGCCARAPTCRQPGWVGRAGRGFW